MHFLSLKRQESASANDICWKLDIKPKCFRLNYIFISSFKVEMLGPYFDSAMKLSQWAKKI